MHNLYSHFLSACMYIHIQSKMKYIYTYLNYVRKLKFFRYNFTSFYLNKHIFLINNIYDFCSNFAKFCIIFHSVLE